MIFLRVKLLLNLWASFGDFFQSIWNTVDEWCDSDPYVTVVWGSSLVTFFVYWTVGLLYTSIDLTGKPAFLAKYKIQDTTPYPVPLNQVLKIVEQILINQFLVGTPFIVGTYYSMFWFGYDTGRIIPTFQRFVLDFAAYLLIEEFIFYYGHRLLHHPRLYKYIHKRHHEWTAPIAITALYCHPIEHCLCNLLPTSLGPLLLGSHMFTAWIWYSVALINTLNSHSGYHFPLCFSAEAHDFHHLKFNQNFGVLGILDFFHGTNSAFRNTKEYQRHFVSLSLVPLKQLYPDDPKNK
ncbi:fatty acid hydroxylase domain-containing protein 2 [Nephila pilipes]|uniref:Fatty acid hydroxylase domain-containing protein 2 n=1 Tax=Nephila pilipes TaxID=299642 RepID=A0A8X6TTW5_NEPPI|nr:fatty acid hydroxylase domain-containing protein 2 [Nephila pilipes]